MDPLSPTIPTAKAFVLAQLTEHSAATWSALGARAFAGRLEVDTENSRYVFQNGVFSERTTREGARRSFQKSLAGLKLVGFLAREGDLWSLAPRFRAGAHAVLWRPSRRGLRLVGDEQETSSFVVTSPVLDARLHALQDEASGVRAASGVFAAAAVAFPRRVPNVPPAPLSSTRLHIP